MDEKYEELAALNALGMLESDEKRVLSGACLSDKELRELSAELEAAAAELARLVAPHEPPSDMQRRIRAKIRARGGPGLRLSPAAMLGTLGWLLAIGLGIATAWLWQQRGRLANDLAAASKILGPAVAAAENHSGEVHSLESTLQNLQGDFDKKQSALTAALNEAQQKEAAARTETQRLVAAEEARKKHEAELKMRVVSLQSDVWEYRRSEMTLIWDGSRNQGVLLLEKMPSAEEGRDYQLWLSDPEKKRKPVSAGIVSVDEKGTAQIQFKTSEPMGEAAKFSLTVEKKGGAESPSNTVVFKER